MQWRSLAIPVERKLPVVELWLGFFRARLASYAYQMRRSPRKGGSSMGILRVGVFAQDSGVVTEEAAGLGVALRSVVEKGLPEFLDCPPAIPVEWIVHGE